MGQLDERREFVRFDNPAKKFQDSRVQLTIPGLAEDTVSPIDFSAGGFKLDASKKPEPGAAVACTIQVAGDKIENCNAHVAWVTENGSRPGTWIVGLSVVITGDDQDKLSSMLTEVLSGQG